MKDLERLNIKKQFRHVIVEWIRIIKTLHMRNKERVQQGKKITYVDDRYLKEAKENLYEEFSIALDIEKDNVEQYITDHL